MLSFKNDQKIKKSLIKRMDNHIKLDQLLQGAIGDNGKGCTVWCALNNGEVKEGYNHAAFESILGLPEWLARLHDAIYEGLTVEDSKWFSKQWVRAIPIGKELEPIKWKLCAFILKENIERVLLLKISDELKKQIVDAINKCLSLHESAMKTGVWDESAAAAARSAESAAAAAAARSAAAAAAAAARSAAAESAAWSAESAESAAWSARSAAAESAAWSARSAESAAAESAARSAESAARSAESAAWSARSAAFKRYAAELLKLFKEI